jgi:hypothetical protein
MTKKNLLDEIPEKFLRALAKEKGYLARPGESVEEIKRWLLAYYRKGVSEIAGKGEDILELANETLRKVRSAIGIPTEEPQDRQQQPPADDIGFFATATMARIYEKQGLNEEAVSVYKKLLERDPGNMQWRKALERLLGAPRRQEGEGGETGPSAAREEEGTTPPCVGAGAISAVRAVGTQAAPVPDEQEMPPGYGSDGMVLMAVGPADLYTYWEVTEKSYRSAVATTESGGTLVLRLLLVALDEEGLVETSLRDEPVDDLVGEYFLHGLKPGGFYRTCLGLKIAGRFCSLVHSGLEATPQAGPGELREEEWIDVDQKPMLWRSREAEPLKIEKSLRLSLREKALLRLHVLGRREGSRYSGIPEERLEKLLRTAGDICGDVKRAEISSPGWDKRM